MDDQVTERRGWALVGVSLVAAVLYSNFLIDWILRGFTDFGTVVSSLEAPGQENATILRVTDVICAVLVLLLALPAREALARGWEREVFALGTVIFAAGATLAAFVPMPCGVGVVCDSAAQRRSADIHDLASIVSETAVFLGMLAVWWLARRTGPRWVVPYAFWLFWLGGVIGTSVFAWFGWNGHDDAMTGYVQRFHILTVSIWIVCLGFLGRARASTSDSTGERP